MAVTIDNIRYPDSYAAVMKDKDLKVAFIAYAKKRAIYNSEIRFLDSTGKNRTIYENYLHPKAPCVVNISNSKRKMAVAVAGQIEGNLFDWQDARMTKVIDDARTEVREMINTDHLTVGTWTFFKSEQFKKVHVERLQTSAKVTKRMLQVLGFENLKSKVALKAVKDMIDAFLAGDDRAAKRALEKAISTEPAGSMVPKTAAKMASLLKKSRILPA